MITAIVWLLVLRDIEFEHDCKNPWQWELVRFGAVVAAAILATIVVNR